MGATPQKQSEVADFWNARWQQGETGWDIGSPAPALISFMANYPVKNASVLIPGCGSAHEAEALVRLGFHNVTLLDIAPEAVARLQKRFGNFPEIKVVAADFFSHKGQYDLILEQTFFCAIPPEKRPDYVQQMAALLSDRGQLVGLLFNKVFDKAGPPFGGSLDEYDRLFRSAFHIQKMEPCHNSIAPRAGTELFIHLFKK